MAAISGIHRKAFRMRIQHLLLAALGCLCLLTTALPAQVPNFLNYQGRVAVGTPPVNFDGTGSFKFALVDGGTNPSVPATAEAARTGSFITAYTVMNPGSGYTSPPAVTVTEGGGTGATATAVLSGGSVVSLTPGLAGSGYTSRPNVSISLPSKTHAKTFWSNDGTSAAGSQPTAALSLQVTMGLYSVLLGDTSPPLSMMAIPSSVFTNPDVRLRVWFNDNTNGSQLLTPDQRLAPNVYPGGQNALTLATPPGMVLIPAGPFTMGNSVAADTDITNAAPVAVTVSAFYMDVNLVTLSQWNAVRLWAYAFGYNFFAGSGKAPNHPVHSVSWYDCVKWCNARSEREGRTPVYYTDDAQTVVYRSGNLDVTNLQVKWNANGFRLPTEAEWEKAARGGLSGQRFPWGSGIDGTLANYYGNTNIYSYDFGPDGFNAIGSAGGTNPATSPVGSFAANGYGVNDMAGNVFQWCWDWYETPYGGGTDPRGPALGDFRIVRGGAWYIESGAVRCAYRNRYAPSAALDSNGVRAALSPTQP